MSEVVEANAGTGRVTKREMTPAELAQHSQDTVGATKRAADDAKRPAPFTDDEITRLRALLTGR